MRLYSAVISGGVLGSVLRWLMAVIVPVAAGGFPWPTFLVNIIGSFVIGFFSTLSGPDGRLFVGPNTRLFVMTGICGGFTTFSSFAVEMLRFVQAGDVRAAVIYLVASVPAWLISVWLGDVVARRLNNPTGL
jgi:fluoride exporter